MGRAKLPLKCIANEKARKKTLMQRRKGLIKKGSAFSTEFGADAGLIVYDSSNGDTAPTIWPDNSTKVLSIIENYNYYQKTQKVSDNFDLEDFFKNKMSKLEGEGSKSHHDHQVCDTIDGVMQDIELVDWDSLPGLLDDWDVIQPDQSRSVPSQIMQQEEILHALPPMDKFQDNSPQI